MTEKQGAELTTKTFTPLKKQKNGEDAENTIMV